MLVSMYFMRESVKRLENILHTLEKNKEKQSEKFDLEAVTANIKEAFFDFRNAMHEVKCFRIDKTDPTLIALGTIMPVIQSSFKNAKTIDEYIAFIQMITGPLKDYSRYEYYDQYEFQDVYRNVFMNDASFGSNEMSIIAKAIKRQGRKIKILDPYCRRGINIFDFAAQYENPVETYGIDANSEVPLDSRGNFDRLILGKLRGSNISNDVFDVVMMNPAVSLIKEGKNVIEKKERDYLYKGTTYLRVGGLMVYAIPYFKYAKEICAFIARNFKDVQIFSTTDAINERKYLYVLGIKKPALERDLDASVYVRLRNACEYDVVANMNPEALDEYVLPLQAAPVKKFRGSVLDEVEFERLYEVSPCTQQFWKDQKVEKLSEHAKQPLLPFNVGQLGLVLTSGCLDGVIQEGDGHCHAVKGRVIKKVDSVNDIDISANQIEVTETTSNRVEINAFLPDGTYKCLA